jgi:integrase
MSRAFNPNQFSGKRVAYISILGTQGICAIWDWNNKKKRYVKRTLGNKYYAFKKMNGCQKSACFETFEQAKHWRDTSNLFEEVVSDNEMTFKQVTEKYLKNCVGRIRVSTYETIESQIKHLRFFNPIPVRQINAKTIDAWIEFVKKPDYLKLQHKSRMTYHHELSVLRLILIHYSEYEDDTYQVPLKKRHTRDCIVDLIKYQQSRDRNKNHFIPRADFEKFLDEMWARAKRKLQYVAFTILAEFQLGSGTRVGEACALSWSDVNLQTGEAFISKTVEWSRKVGRPTVVSPLTKTGNSRTIYISQRALVVLNEWKLRCGRREGLIFSYDGAKPICYRSAQHHFSGAFRALNMPWRSTHILRHSYSTDFLERTKDKLALQGQLGHSSSRQTDHYAKVTDATKRNGVQAYNQSLIGSNVIDMFTRFNQEKP